MKLKEFIETTDDQLRILDAFLADTAAWSPTHSVGLFRYVSGSWDYPQRACAAERHWRFSGTST